MEYQKKSYHMEAVCGSAHYQIAAYWSRVLNKPAIKAYQASRRGIVLTANYTATQKGVKTGLALWQAKSACPDLVVVPPRMELYLQFSSMLREIYGEYTDLVEPYGCDEAWLDVTGSTALKGDEKKIADEIRSRVKRNWGSQAVSGFRGIRFLLSLEAIIKNQMRSPNFIKKITRVSSGIFLQLTFCMSEDLPERC